MTSPRLLLSASHRRFGSVRAGTGDVERAPSRERVVVPTERRRPRRACADRAVDTRARRAVCAVCRVTSPRLLLSASHRRFGSVRAGAGDAERAPSRERVVVPTERRRPRRACADRAVDTRARRVVCAVCRVTSPRLLLSASHRRFGSVRADAGDAGASAEPRASRRADRAPPTSSCVRRSRRRHTRAPCRCVFSDRDVNSWVACWNCLSRQGGVAAEPLRHVVSGGTCDVTRIDLVALAVFCGSCCRQHPAQGADSRRQGPFPLSSFLFRKPRCVESAVPTLSSDFLVFGWTSRTRTQQRNRNLQGSRV